MENITPNHLRCGPGSCPSVHRTEDGKLIIVGRRARIEDVPAGSLPNFDFANEEVVVIDEAYFANLPR